MRSQGPLMRELTPILAVAGLFLAVAAGSAQAADCSKLVALQLSDVRIASAEKVPSADGMPGHCRVRGVAAKSIGFEVWLPESGWNGRLLSVGNGGFGGEIQAAALADGLRQGYAVTGNDTGHQGEDRAWMADRVRVGYWGHSAVHLTTGPAKAIVRAYYGAPARFAYFTGCSTGGAEAMEEAEYFPGDYDGIVAGAPGMSYARLMLSFLWGLKAAEAGAVIPQAKLVLLHQAVVDACDGLDGLKDGLISDPQACRFDPSRLTCPGADAPDCLTAAEVKTAQLIYQGPRNPRTGAQIYPGFAYGSEADPAAPAANPFAYGWGGIQGPLAQMFAIPLMRDMVYRDPNWDWRRFDWDKDVADLDLRIAAEITATDPDLRAFARHGKLIMYQGWGDPLNAQTLPADYRGEVIDLFAWDGGRGQAEQRVDGFFRLFMAPGMAHCTGGPGPSHFDSLAALKTWVEEGRPPDRIVADGGPILGPGVARPLCAYPKTARFEGGDPKDARSFRCVAG
jgi:feruloyl esterase